MKIKHNAFFIDTQTPFLNCKLGREKYALVLTEIINEYADGFVLAINNEWGTGKTTFVKMWQQHLINNEFQTIYFNTWENDFDGNPLVAIISELKSLTNPSNKEAFKSIVEKGAVLIKNVVPALAKSLVKKYVVDIDEISTEAIENATKGTAEIFEEEIKEYSKKKKTITEFRKDLENFIKKSDSDKPLVFIIDELDRCRPDYAVEVLEQMKHFFSVPGIVFVLSIDKNHLSSAVRGFYGSEQINTDEYLRRFIDLEYAIPAPSNKDFCKYLYSYYSFDEFFDSDERKRISQLRDESHLLLKMAGLLFKKTNTTLRQQENIFGQTRLILSLFKSNQYTFPYLLFVLIYIKVLNGQLYKKIEANTISLQELSDAFANLVPSSKTDLQEINLIYVEALLLHFYNNNQEYQNRATLYETDAEGKLTTSIISILEKKIGLSSLANSFGSIRGEYTYADINLNYLLDKINLTEPLVIQ